MKLWRHWIEEILFPPRCPICDDVIGRLPQCPHCANFLSSVKEGFAATKQNHIMDFVEQIQTVYLYEPPFKQAVLRAKYEGRQDLISFFAKKMANQVQKEKMQVQVVIAVPSHRQSIRRRGHDTAGLFAKEVANQLELPFLCDVLYKPQMTKEQHKLSKKERKINLLGAFAVQREEKIINRSVLLVDDILTTGATLNECAKMLLVHGAKECSAVCLAMRPVEKENP